MPFFRSVLSGRSLRYENGPVPAPRRWVILVVLACASFMDQLDTTVTVVAAPSVRRELGGGSATVQWLAAAYTLAFAVLLITGGRLGDIYGRRRMFLTGCFGFTAASVACGLSISPGQLIAARVVQGAFAALLVPQGLGIIKMVFPPRQLGTAFGVFAPVMGMATVCGPVIAGALISADFFGSGWRMVFLINLPVGVAVMACALVVLPRGRDRRAMKLGFSGTLLVTAAAALIIFPLVQGRTLGWPAWTWIMLAAGVAGFVLFAVHERTSRTPVIEPGLLRNRTYRSGVAVAVVFFGIVSGQALVLSMYMQVGLHYTPLRAALTGVPFSLGIAVTSAFANRLATRFGRRVLHAGLTVMAAGLLTLASFVHRFGPSITAGDLMLATTVLGSGMGLVFGPLFRAILGGVSQQESGSASGVLSAVQQLGGSLGVAVIATLYFSLTPRPSQTSAGMTITALTLIALVACTYLLVFLLPAREIAIGRESR